MRNPKVSVVMPVYNGEKYLREAIESILFQTFSDFEFIILDDNSQDKSVDIIKSFPDMRIRLVIHKEKKDIAALLNEGFEIANGEYIARMDCDDISLPKRLEKQVKFMDINKHIGICGTWVKTIGWGNGDKLIKYPIEHKYITVNMFFANHSFVHPSVMLRKNIFIENNLFYNDIRTAEDYDLWERMRKCTIFANISQCLMRYRLSKKNYDYLKNDRIASANIQKRLIREIVDEISEAEWKIHSAIANLNFDSSKEFLSDVDNWFSKLISLNKKKKKFNQEALGNLLAFKWILICKEYPPIKLIKLVSFWAVHLKYITLLSVLQKMMILSTSLAKMLQNFRGGKTHKY